MDSLPSTRRPPVLRQVPAVTRAIAILRFLGRSHAPVGVVQIANTLGMVPSTCLHIMRVLNGEGLVSFDLATRKYRLGAGVLALGQSFNSSNLLVQFVRPHLEGVSRDYGCTAVAVEPSEPDHYIVVATSSNSPFISVRVNVGTRVPALSGAPGRCIAAHGQWTRTDLRRRFGRIRWQNPPSFETWQDEVAQARERGYALDVNNYIAGLTMVAVPIQGDAGAVLGVLTTVKMSDQTTEGESAAIARMLQASAAELRAQLVHGDSPQPAQTLQGSDGAAGDGKAARSRRGRRAS